MILGAGVQVHNSAGFHGIRPKFSAQVAKGLAWPPITYCADTVHPRNVGDPSEAPFGRSPPPFGKP